MHSTESCAIWDQEKIFSLDRCGKRTLPTITNALFKIELFERVFFESGGDFKIYFK